MTGSPRVLARRYARALLDAARGRGPDAPLALRDELRAFVPAVSGHQELRRALRHPALGPDARRRLVAAIAEAAGGSALLRRLLEILATRNRLSLLPDVAEAYAQEANAASGVVSAEAVSATPLPEQQRRALAAVFGDAVELRTRVDPGLLGGLVVRVGGRTYDGSVRTRLATLGRRLASASPPAAPSAS